MGKAKSFLKSKTFWFNVLAAAGLTALHVTGTQVDPQIQGAVLAGGNVLLRLLTKQPVNLLGE